MTGEILSARFLCMDTVIITTRPCFHCGATSEVEVTASDFARRQAGATVQEAFPEMPVDTREMLVSGTHPACWITMFGEDD